MIKPSWKLDYKPKAIDKERHLQIHAEPENKQ